MTVVLREPFNDLTKWTGLSLATVVVGGRNGSACQLAGAGQALFSFEADQSEYVTVGLAYQVATLSAARAIMTFRGDGNTTTQVTMMVTTGGAIEARLGGTAGNLITTTAAGMVTAATWVYIEIQIRIHDTLGTVVIRTNGVERVNVSAKDTRFSGADLACDGIQLLGTLSVNTLYDDLYIATGVAETFRGDVPIIGALDYRQSARVAVVTPGDAQNYRQSARVATQSPGDAQLYRQQLRVGIDAPTEAQLAQISTRMLVQSPSEARLAQVSVRALISLAAVAGTSAVYVWNGTSFVAGPTKTWSGSAFVAAAAVRTWLGSTFSRGSNPFIVSTSSQNGTSLGSNTPIPTPEGVAVGDLLVAAVSHDSGTNATASTGWTTIVQTPTSGGLHRLAVFARIADLGANDTLSLTGSANDYCAAILRVIGHGVVSVATDIKSAPANNTTGHADPPSLDAGAVRKWLWLACAAVDGATTAADITAVPTDYTQVVDISSTPSTSSSLLGIARREIETQTQDPGVFTLNSNSIWAAATVAIPPA